jgi:histone deacetylase 6
MAASGEEPMQVDEAPKPILAPLPVSSTSSGNVTGKPEVPRASSVPARASSHTAGFVYSAEMTAHFVRSDSEDHVERPERIARIWNMFVANKYNTRMKWLPIRPVQKFEALLVHTEDHWNKIQAFKS